MGNMHSDYLKASDKITSAEILFHELISKKPTKKGLFFHSRSTLGARVNVLPGLTDVHCGVP
jgi:hypothetical protein